MNSSEPIILLLLEMFAGPQRLLLFRYSSEHLFKVTNGKILAL